MWASMPCTGTTRCRAAATACTAPPDASVVAAPTSASCPPSRRARTTCTCRSWADAGLADGLGRPGDHAAGRWPLLSPAAGHGLPLRWTARAGRVIHPVHPAECRELRAVDVGFESPAVVHVRVGLRGPGR